MCNNSPASLHLDRHESTGRPTVVLTFPLSASSLKNDSSIANSLTKSVVSQQLKQLPYRVALVLTCVLSLLLLGGCGKDSTENAESPQVMRELLAVKLPNGLELSAAKALMEKEGFACELKEKTFWKKKGVIDFLQCKRQDGSPPIFRMWDVAVFHDGTKVTGVEVRSALKYP